MMKHLPNIISALRIIAAVCLLFCNVTGWSFWVLYSLCGYIRICAGRALHQDR